MGSTIYNKRNLVVRDVDIVFRVLLLLKVPRKSISPYESPVGINSLTG